MDYTTEGRRNGLLGQGMSNRQPNRLEQYDYSQNGAYYITICTKDRQNILWEHANNQNPTSVGANSVRPQKLSKCGIIINDAIVKIPNIYDSVFVEKYVIMPNHIHLIILIDNDLNKRRTMFAPTISRVVKQFKGYCTKQMGKTIWQKSFYDHIIRNEIDYHRIWQYIDENPAKWELDEYYTD